MSRYSYFIGAVVLFYALFGCSPKSGRDDSKDSVGRTVTDMMGTVVVLPDETERAVVLVTDVCKVVYALGAWDRVVGVSRYCYSDPIMRRLVPTISDLPSPGSGFDVNTERLIALRPDVVIVWASTSTEKPPPTAQQLRRRGIPTVVVRCWKLKDIYRMIRLVGRVFNREERAEALVSYLEEMVTLVKSRTERMHPMERPSVLWLWTEPTRVTGGVGLTNELIELGGGRNPAKGFKVPYATVSVEQIIEWNPDALVIWESARYDEDAIIGDPRWRTVTAVKKRMVRKSREYGGLWSPDVVLKLLELAAWLHPDRFSDVDIDEVVRKFHIDCYGCSF